jgi:hypothetical protein
MWFLNACSWVLDLLFISWFFWPVAFGLPVICYFVIASSFKEDKYTHVPEFLLAIVIGAVLWRYPDLRHYATDWHNWAYVIGGYAVAGFLMSLYKWLRVIGSFRSQDVKGTIARIRSEVNTVYHMNHEEARAAEATQQLRRKFDKCKVVLNDDKTISIWPDRSEYSISSWWVYWPFFLLELPFELVGDICRACYNTIRRLYDGIAQSFSVKG